MIRCNGEIGEIGRIMHLPPIGISMVGSMVGIFFGIAASGLFLLGDSTISAVGSSAPVSDLLTVRLGAICSLLIAGGGVITAVGGQILGAYKLYLQQRESDFHQSQRHEDMIDRLTSSIDVSRTLEKELVEHRDIAMGTIDEMKARVLSIQSMIDDLTKELKRTVVEQAIGTRDEIKEAIVKSSGSPGSSGSSK